MIEGAIAKKMKIMEGKIAKKSNSKNDLKLHKYQLKEWGQNLTNKKITTGWN